MRMWMERFRLRRQSRMRIMFAMNRLKCWFVGMKGQPKRKTFSATKTAIKAPWHIANRSMGPIECVCWRRWHAISRLLSPSSGPLGRLSLEQTRVRTSAIYPPHPRCDYRARINKNVAWHARPQRAQTATHRVQIRLRNAVIISFDFVFQIFPIFFIYFSFFPPKNRHFLFFALEAIGPVKQQNHAILIFIQKNWGKTYCFCALFTFDSVSFLEISIFHIFF